MVTKRHCSVEADLFSIITYIVVPAGSVTSITFWTNVLTNAIKKLDAKKTNIIILVIDSNSLSNIKYEKRQKRTELDSIKNHLDEELEEEVETDE